MATHDRYIVSLFGAYFDVGNLGCRALAASLIKLILDTYPDAEINLLYGTKAPGTTTITVGDRDVVVNIVNMRMSPKSRINQHVGWITGVALLYKIIPIKKVRKLLTRMTPWLNVLERSDFVGDIRAGDSFSDIYGISRVIFGSIPAITAILLNKKLVLLPQTYGPYISPTANKIARYIFRRSNVIYGRDNDSLSLVRDILGKNSNEKNIYFCPDVAFSMESHIPETIDILPAMDTTSDANPLIGINVSGLLYNGGYNQSNMFGLSFEYHKFIVALVEHLLKTTNAKILLVPHVISIGVESDTDACQKVFEKCGGVSRERLFLLKGNYNQYEIKGIIGKCDFFIGSRMHSCIAALSQGIPSVGIAYSKKFLGVFQSAGIADFVLDAREMNMQDIIQTCGELFNRCSDSKKDLSDAVTGIKKTIENIFHAELKRL